MSLEASLNDLSLNKLNNLKNNIQELKSKINLSAKENFDNKILNLLPTYKIQNTDSIVCFPDEKYNHICILFYKHHDGEINGKAYSYKIKLVFNSHTVKIKRIVVCSCFSPYYCYKCYDYKDEIDSDVATYNVETEKYQINAEIKEEYLINSIPRILAIFQPLYKEFDNLYNGYFHDLKIDNTK